MSWSWKKASSTQTVVVVKTGGVRERIINVEDVRTDRNDGLHIKTVSGTRYWPATEYQQWYTV